MPWRCDWCRDILVESQSCISSWWENNLRADTANTLMKKSFISSSFNLWKMDDMNHFGTDEVITEGHRVIARHRGVIGRHVGSAVALYTLMMHSRAPNTVGRLSSTGAWTSKAATATWTDGKYRMGLDRIGWWPPDGGSNIFRTTPNL